MITKGLFTPIVELMRKVFNVSCQEVLHPLKVEDELARS